MANLGTIEAQSYAARLSALNSFLSSYNSAAGAVAKIEASQSPSSSTGSISANQQKYLENLIKNGTSGQAAWAKAQLGATVSSQPTSSSLSKNITPVSGATTNSSTNINSLNISSNAKSMDAIIKEASSQVKVLKR